MLDKVYIRAIYTPDEEPVETSGTLTPPLRASKPQSVTIVGFSDDTRVALFIDEQGNLKHGWLRQFSKCVLVPFREAL